jgi:hypothetical protein
MKNNGKQVSSRVSSSHFSTHGSPTQRLARDTMHIACHFRRIQRLVSHGKNPTVKYSVHAHTASSSYSEKRKKKKLLKHAVVCHTDVKDTTMRKGKGYNLQDISY